ncbi:MAG: NUDIX hydrolase [Rhodospirillales bacterium]|nr:MAG: NUDIX hydrolase [Rhodospirillales bacterium]
MDDDPRRRHGHPVSVKGVVLVDGRALLLRDIRDAWDLPGGRPDADESWTAALAREAREEANIGVEVGPLLREWTYEVLPGRFVWIVAFGCRALDVVDPRPGAEHRELRWVAPDALDGLRLHDGYRRAIEVWAARSR